MLIRLKPWIDRCDHPMRVRIAVTVGVLVTTALTVMSMYHPPVAHAATLSGTLTNLIWIWE